MNFGQFDRQLLLQKPAPASQDAFGAPAPAAFEDVATVWAGQKYGAGSEAFLAQEQTTQQVVTWQTRYRPDLNTTWQFVCEGQLYQITAIAEIGRRAGLLLTTYSRGAAPAAVPIVPAKKRMAVCLLDSITAGYAGLTPATAWPAQFAPLVADRYGVVVNKAISGNTTQNGLARMADILSAYNLVDYAGVDVFYLGGVNNLGNESQEVATVLNQYATTFAQLKAPAPSKVRVYVLTLPAATWPSNAAVVTGKINDLNAAIRAQAVSLGATAFIDLARQVEFQDPSNRTYYVDGVHPTLVLAQLLAQVVADFAVHGAQPSGPILVNPTPPAAVWVAPETGDSPEYNANRSEWAATGQWTDFFSSVYWADGEGMYADNAGDSRTSPTLYCRSVRALTATTASNGGTSLLELVRASDNVVVDSKTVVMRGPDGIVNYTLTAPALGIYYYRQTNQGGGQTYLSGIILTRNL